MRIGTLVGLAILAAACGSGSASPDQPDQLQGALDDGPAPAAAEAGEYYDAEYLMSNVGNFPSLDDPRLVAAADATWIAPDDIVMGVVADTGEAQAYPVNQMAFHHIANTELAGEPFLVTY